MKLRDRITELRRVKASELIPSPQNWRVHPEAQQAAMKGILSEVGIADALLVRETPDGYQLIDGHLRADTAPDTEWPVLVLDVTEDEARKLLATHDPLAAMAEVDEDKLAELLAEIETDSDALQAMLDALAEEAGIDDDPKDIVEDEPPPVPADPITQVGDLWILGDHRLLCGDSTKAEDVERLMDGARAGLCFTSPPYNAGIVITDGKHPQKYTDDPDNRPADEYRALLSGFLSAAMSVSDYVFVNVQMLAGNKTALIDFLYENKETYADCLIWDKLTAEPAMPRKVTNSRFEFIHVFSGKANRAIGTRDFRGDVDNLVTMNSRSDKVAASVHKASFPVALPSWVLEKFSVANDVILDSFCGTGTTLIAAEQLGRKCYGMEISPAYCDVIVQRWENLTGEKAERLEAATA